MRSKVGSHRWLPVAALVIAGCNGPSVRVMEPAPPQAVHLGHAEGSACGTMLLGPTAYNFIPATLNSRTERAYQDAIASVPQATALTDVNIEEQWFWWVIGTTRCVTITGEAVR